MLALAVASHILTIQQRGYVEKDAQNRFIPTNLGLALIEAYDSMGYQLSKPHLRAATEKDCQKIARGELAKADVIRNCLQQMKACFESEKTNQCIQIHSGCVSVKALWLLGTIKFS